MKTFQKLTLIGATLFLFAVIYAAIASTLAEAAGNSYYVALTGNDANPGTLIEPWRSIQHAADTAVAGDMVYVQAGTYYEAVTAQLHSGSPGNPITFAAYPGDSVSIDAKGLLSEDGDGSYWRGPFAFDNVSYIKLSGFRLLNSGLFGVAAYQSDHIVIENNAIHNTYHSGIAVWDSQNVEVRNNEVTLCVNGGEQECISVAESQNVQVIGNEVHHGGDGANGGEGIDVKDGSSYVLVQGNYVHDLQRICLYVDAWNKHTHHIVLDGNRAHDCISTGIALASERGGLVEAVTIQNNVVYHASYVGLSIGDWDKGWPHPMRGVTVTNNTFYNNGYNWGGGVEILNPEVEDLLVQNNIFSQNQDFQIIDKVGGSEVSIDRNLIHGEIGWEGDGATAGNAPVMGDPFFVNAAANDFHLKQNSPAIDRAYSAGAPNRDFDGNPRPAGRGYDIGAFEFSPALILTLSPGEQTLYLRWQLNAALPATSTWQIDYQSAGGSGYPPVAGIISPTRAYSLTGLSNYAPYTVTLSATLNSAPFLSDTAVASPTDIFIYLPLILKV